MRCNRNSCSSVRSIVRSWAPRHLSNPLQREICVHCWSLAQPHRQGTPISEAASHLACTSSCRAKENALAGYQREAG